MLILSRDGILEVFEANRVGERSPDHQWAIDGSACHRVLWMQRHRLGGRVVDDSARYHAAKALLGYNVMRTQDIFNATSGNPGVRRWIERGLPHAYPAVVDPDLNPQARPFLFAQSIGKCEAASGHTTGNDGLFSDGGPHSRDGINLFVTYRGLPYNCRVDNDVLAQSGDLSASNGDGVYVDINDEELTARPDEGERLAVGWGSTRHVVKSEHDGSVQITLPQGTLKFIEKNDAGNTDAVPSGFPWHNGKIVTLYEWVLVPIDAIPRAAIDSCLNTVNDSTFDGHPPGTVAFTGYQVVIRRGPLGDFLANVVYRMAVRRNFDQIDNVARGWNAWPRIRGGKLRYDLASSSGGVGGNYPYPARNLAALFRPDQDMPI